jgi:hypothetical protein
LFEPKRQPVAIRAIRIPSRHLDYLPDDSLQAEFDERAIANFEQPIGNVNSVIGIDLDQVGVKGRMTDLG